MQVEKIPTLLYDHVAECSRLLESMNFAIESMEREPVVLRNHELGMQVKRFKNLYELLNSETKAARVAASKNRINWAKVLNWLGVGRTTRDMIEMEAEFDTISKSYNPDGLQGRDELSEPMNFVTVALSTGRLRQEQAA
jgi:hypothetical protein